MRRLARDLGLLGAGLILAVAGIQYAVAHADQPISVCH